MIIINVIILTYLVTLVAGKIKAMFKFGTRLCQGIVICLCCLLMVGCIPTPVQNAMVTENVVLPTHTIQSSPSPFKPAKPSRTLPPADSTPIFTPLSPAATATLVPVPTQDDRRYTVDSSIVDVWDDPAHEGDYLSRQTQLVTGEQVLVLEQSGEWAWVVAVWQASRKDARGYPGWLRIANLSPGWITAESYAVVMTPQAVIRRAANAEAEVVQPVYLDARFPVIKIEAGWVMIHLPRFNWVVA